MSIRFKKFYHRHKKLTVTLTVICSVVLVFIMLCLTTYIPKVNGTEILNNKNPYIGQTKISAHRAGKNLAPENTLAAFKTCFEKNNDYVVDILEFDLHITKDDYLILLHDDTIDRTSDARSEKFGEKNVRPENKTLRELKEYNMGYSFQAEDGSYPYRAPNANLKDCRVVVLEEVLEYLRTQENVWKKSFHYIIEIKNGGDLGRKATDILYNVMEQYNILDRTIIGTFKGEITQYMDETYPDIVRSASIAEVFEFYFSCMFNVDLSKKDIKYNVLQIPYRDYGINFGKKSIVDYAHYHGLAVQYWTINRAKDIEHLISIGADAVITDDPRLAYQILHA